MKWVENNKIYGEIKDKTLYRLGLDNEHLMHKYGGVPALNKRMYDSLPNFVKDIKCETKEGRKFFITREDFDRYKELINYGDQQYVVPFDKWYISD